MNDLPTSPTRWTLADGREIMFYALPGHAPAPVPDLRRLPEREVYRSELRFDRQTGQWVTIAPYRQDRTYKPAAANCPLCPDPSGMSSEVPASDYDVVVFENRFPSFAGIADAAIGLSSPDGTGFASAPGHGRCEIICFCSDHNASLAELEHRQVRLVVDAWRHRTADLVARPGIEQVFCFENRGEEIGVTLPHPHGQIYGYPFLAPRTAEMLRQAQIHRSRHGSNLFADLLAHEIADGRRIVERNELFTAFVPFAARWPVEVHIYPNRFVHNLGDLEEAELDGFAQLYASVLRRFDRIYSTPLPYMAALHQYTGRQTQEEGYFHVELMSIRRSAGKLKYLAASESAMSAFLNDVTPERTAQQLREA